MDDFIKVMKALSDPNRVRIVKLLQARPLCVCEIQAALGVAQPTVSKHCKILEASGLVSHWKNGLWVHYRLADGQASPYASALLGNLRHWLEDDRDLAGLRERLSLAVLEIQKDRCCAKITKSSIGNIIIQDAGREPATATTPRPESRGRGHGPASM